MLGRGWLIDWPGLRLISVNILRDSIFLKAQVNLIYLAILSPGKVNNAPMLPHHSAMKNFKTSFDAGPLEVDQ